MKLSVPERQIKVIVLCKEKGFNCRNTILADKFFLIRMAILSNFHKQNPGYLQGRVLCNMIWHVKFIFIFSQWKGGTFEICLLLYTKFNYKGRKQ